MSLLCFFRVIIRAGTISLAAFFLFAASTPASAREETDLSGPGWHLWQDSAAAWQTEDIYAPGTDLGQMTSHPPTGGWDQLPAQPAVPVSVPGTVEEYLYHWNPAKPDSKESQGMKGVSWWYRTLEIPASITGKRVLLQFESTRFRAEIYLNHKLVGYDLVEGTPFTIDLTGKVRGGESAQLAVRITNPGGMWSWEDFKIMKWGTKTIPVSRGFGGITGSVKLQILPPVHVEDVYVQNTPAMRDVNVLVTVQNDSPSALQGTLQLRVAAQSDPGKVVAQKVVSGLSFPAGASTQTVKLSAPQAKLWDLDHPNLYVCKVSLADGQGKDMDTVAQDFGFRWFAPEDIGQNAVFRLNGKRIVLRTAISWGLWGNTGLVPSPELAARQISEAKTLGLNMLNFHRAIGQTSVLDKADEMGLLYFEEPGDYATGSAEPFCELLAREKLLRMVKRDRSHPSLVIFNMINEDWTKYGADKNEKLYDTFKSDMAAAHKIDPSREIVLASAWARTVDADEPVKLNMRPFDDQQYLRGWWDFHRAAGPESWEQDFYQGPDNHYALTTNRKEIVYWGEEGAISSPPRVALIKKDLESLPTKGWDGEIYLDWYRRFDDYLKKKKLQAIFPTVDSFTVALSAVAMEHQGRKIEDTRICDLNDGYAINGWEAEPYENHSGVVDGFRHPKGDPNLIAYYNQPLYVAVKTRNQVVASGDPATVDYYLINEKDVKGPHTLQVAALRADGKTAFQKDFPITITGGETYGELLTQGVVIPTDTTAGMWTLKARLVDAAGKEVAAGHDQILVVDWKDEKLAGNGAVYEEGTRTHNFLASQKGLDVPAYSDALGKLDWVLVSRGVFNQPHLVAHDFLTGPDGSKSGLKATFFTDTNFTQVASSRIDPQINLTWAKGAAPAPHVVADTAFSARWEGNIVPPSTGDYIFTVRVGASHAQLKINGREYKTNDKVRLTAGQPASLVLDYVGKGGKGGITLLWNVPNEKAADATALIDRARKDGSTVILADHADAWMDLVKAATKITYTGPIKIGKFWVGGQYFAIRHPLFDGLPVDQALNWPYQAVIGNGMDHYGLDIQGEQLVAGCWQSTPFALGTAVGIIPCGKGRIIFSTLDICPHLGEPPGPADVARKLLCNYLKFAITPQ